MAIAIGQLVERGGMHAALSVHSARLDHDILGFLVITPRIHAQRAADRARHTNEIFQTGNAGLLRRLGDHFVQRTGTGLETRIGNGFRLRERASETNDHAADTTITHQRIRPGAQYVNGHIARCRCQESCEVLFIRRQIHHVRRTTDPQPGHVFQGRVLDIFAAHIGKAGNQAQPSASSSPCRA